MTSKWYNLLLFNDVLQVLDGFTQIHVLNGLRSLAGILKEAVVSRGEAVAYLVMNPDVEPSGLACYDTH